MEINREHIASWLKDLQGSICTALEIADGSAQFEEDTWTRKEGGGGRTRIIKEGTVIEKGGVLFSAVEGETPDFLLREQQHRVASVLNLKIGSRFFATGLSIVIHPKSPMVPIIHMNIRYFEMGPNADGSNTRWLGGGIDLTPHYVVENDARYFHAELKKVCDKHHPNYYSQFKKWADDYFFISHRLETRGVGGIFFDRLQSNAEMKFEQNFDFWKDVGKTFAPVYSELISRTKNLPYSDKNKQWQLLRRGRYVEFNLVYDKGTQFGLQTNGRVESILMSLPKLAGWEYNFKVENKSEEEKTLGFLKKGIEWV